MELGDNPLPRCTFTDDDAQERKNSPYARYRLSMYGILYCVDVLEPTRKETDSMVKQYAFLLPRAVAQVVRGFFQAGQELLCRAGAGNEGIWDFLKDVLVSPLDFMRNRPI